MAVCGADRANIYEIKIVLNMDNTVRTLLAKLEKVRDNQDGTEDWKVDTNFEVINYGFIKCLEKGKKGLKFDAVKVVRKTGVEFPRSFTDYEVTIDRAAIPSGVEVIEM